MVHFDELSAPKPDLAAIERTLSALAARLESSDTDTCAAALSEWDEHVRGVRTWANLAYVWFSRATDDADAKSLRLEADEMRPKLDELDLAFKSRIIQAPEMETARAQLGEHLLVLWQTQIDAFDSSVEDDLVREAHLGTRYTALLGSASVEFQGEEVNLSTLRKFENHPARETRHGAAKAYWGWFAANRDALDAIFSELVEVRTSIAKALGFESFVELGYKRMGRTDYDRADVQRFRARVRDVVVPLAAQLREKQAAALGVDTLMAWDEGVSDPAGNPKPQGERPWMVDQATAMFDDMGSEIADLFASMRDNGYLDLDTRPGKAPGGYCASIDTIGMPFVFANFNGSKGDVEVFTHEMGHALQAWLSREHISDLVWPTSDACEIHSMSLEFLTWPHMERFFSDDDAARFRRIHLRQSLLFLCYGVAVDHFQHLVYDEPNATPERRFELWRQMEETYMPWRNWGDVPHANAGGRWQAQMHIYEIPFYYIDYTLAQTCAFQFLQKSRVDFEGAWGDYISLCKRGGEAPFQSLARSAGLISPFDPGCLETIVEALRDELLSSLD